MKLVSLAELPNQWPSTNSISPETASVGCLKITSFALEAANFLPSESMRELLICELPINPTEKS
jgi:hypothetical protein